MIANRLVPPLAVIATFAVTAYVLVPHDAPVAPLPQLQLPAPAPAAVDAPRSSFARAITDLEACFLEWNEREPGDASLTVRADIYNGFVHAQTYWGTKHPSLRYCVSEALARVRLAEGENDDRDVFVRWTNGRVELRDEKLTGWRVMPSEGTIKLRGFYEENRLEIERGLQPLEDCALAEDEWVHFQLEVEDDIARASSVHGSERVRQCVLNALLRPYLGDRESIQVMVSAGSVSMQEAEPDVPDIEWRRAR